MGKDQKIKSVVRRFRAGKKFEDFGIAEEEHLVHTLRERTLCRAVARSAGMETKYHEKDEGKKSVCVTRGFDRALKRAKRNSYASVQRVQKTYPGPRVSNGLTRRTYYE